MNLRIPLQRLVDGDIQFPRNHPGNGIHKCIGQIHDTSHIPYHALCRQGTEGHNLHHLVASVFPAHIIDDFLPAVVTEIHIDIRHGHTLRIQETLKKQIVPDRLDIRNLQAVCHDAPCAGASARPYRNPVAPGVIDKIPHNQEVVHISHPANDGKFVVKSLAQRLSGIACGHTAVAVAFLQPVIAEFIQISPRVIALRHLISGQLGLPERNLHIAPVGNALGILQSLPRIGKQPLHLLLALHEILAALIAHPVLVRQLLVGLKAQQNIVGIRVPGIGVVDVIGGHQRDIQLPAHLQQLRIYHALFRIAVILKLQEKISLPEAFLILPRSLTRLVRPALGNAPLHLPGQTCRQGDNPLVIAVQNLHVHPGLVAKPLRESPADDLH